MTETPMLPSLVEGWVSHRRNGPVRHSFRHGVYQWLIDLDDVPALPWYLRPFASFRSADHLGDPARGIKTNVECVLATHGVHLGEGSRILMLANARVLGHVFDPLSVFWCFDSQGRVACVVAEVHNTYGDRHAYLLRPDETGKALTDKEFYVSPFFDVSGTYELRFALTPDRVGATVMLRREGAVAFTASFYGCPAPATAQRLVRAVLRYPLMTQRVSMLIRLHGLWLWLRRLPVRGRPPHIPPAGVRP